MNKEQLHKEIKYPSREPSYYRKKNNERYAENRKKYLLLVKKHYRSLEGYQNYLYRNILGRVKKNTKRKLGFTKEEFNKFMEQNSEWYLQLWAGWVFSGCKKKHAPSIDRIDNSKGYFLDNIQLMTHGDNSSKGHHIDYAHKK